MSRESLGYFELLVLLALLRVGEEAYGVPIARAIERAKRYFAITVAGRREVGAAKKVLTLLWEGIPLHEGQP